MRQPVLRIPADFMRSRAVSALSEGPCRGDALYMHLECASNCAREEQDGIVTRGEAIRLGVHPDAPSELVRVGLWRQTDVGFEIVAWPEIFPPSARRRCADTRRETEARQRLAARECRANAADGPKPVEHAETEHPTVTSGHPAASVAMSRRDGVLFAVASRASCLGDPRNDTFGPLLSAPAVEEPARELSSTPHVRGTQLTDIETATKPITDEELFGIGDEAGMDVALKDLNLKNYTNSLTTPPPSSRRSIEHVPQTSSDRTRSKAARRPAARRIASDAGLWLPFEATSPQPQAADTLAARGARLIFEATSLQHPPHSLKHKQSCEWLAERPAAEWAIAKPVLLAEANKRGVQRMLTPSHIAEYWATHYAAGIAPRSRADLDRERASLKPFRAGFVGPSRVHTDAEYAAEYAAARAGTLGATC